MTEMRRVTISLPDDIDHKVLELRKNDDYVRLSYAEIVRRLLTLGLKAEARKKAKNGE